MSEKITKRAEDVKLIVFACEAGMGSSLRRRTWMCRSSTLPCTRFRRTPT